MLLPIASYAQFGEGTFVHQVDAESVATGGCLIDFSTATSTDISFQVQRPYSLKSLDRVGVQMRLPFSPMLVQAAFHQSGDNVLSEKSVQLGFVKQVSRTLSVSIGCGLFLLRSVTDYSGNGVFADLSVHYLINDGLKAGVRLINPTAAPVRCDGEKKPLQQSWIIGLRYSPSAQLDLQLEGEKQPKKQALARLGLTYKLDNAFVVMGGLSSYPLQPTGGVFLRTGRVSYALGINVHPRLGVSPAFTCSYTFRRKP